jgi:hypothetical protein
MGATKPPSTWGEEPPVSPQAKRQAWLYFGEIVNHDWISTYQVK